MDTVEGLLIDFEMLLSELRSTSNAQQTRLLRREIRKLVRRAEQFIREFEEKVFRVRVELEILCPSVQRSKSKARIRGKR